MTSPSASCRAWTSAPDESSRARGSSTSSTPAIPSSSPRYDAEGADELVFLDITATVEGRPATLDVISRTAEQVFIPLTVGGGVRAEGDVRALLLAGADKVVNSAAVREPALLARCADRFGTVHGRGDRRETTHRRLGGIRRCRADADSLDAAERASAATERHGAGEVLLTSMDRDGTGEGYDLELLRAVGDAVRVPLVASGAGRVEHFAEALSDGGADAVLAASRFHFEELAIRDVKDLLARRGSR